MCFITSCTRPKPTLVVLPRFRHVDEETVKLSGTDVVINTNSLDEKRQHQEQEAPLDSESFSLKHLFHLVL